MQAMATLLPNPKLLSSQSLTDCRNLLPYYFSRPTLTINCDKPVCASTILSRRISFTSRRGSQTTSTGASIVSGEEEEDWDDDEKEEEEEEGEEFMPLWEMTRWLQNKPAGFGEGKMYDTTVEDKLLEEIKRNQKDQLEENGKPRAGGKENAGSVKKQEKQNVTEVIKSDSEVRVWNLPKKRNIDRDLRKAFKGFPGIISINPAVTGNRKTRDPICKGFAFIGFESDDAAYRFVQKYSKQTLLFGKAQKQIFCDVINVYGVLKSPESSKSSSTSTSKRRQLGDEISMQYASDISKSTNGIEPDKDEFSMLPKDRNISLTNNEAAVVAFEQSRSSCPGFVEGENELNEDLQSNTPMPSSPNGKKIAKRDKTKPPKFSKAHKLGSLAKLKIKDRAVLTGVFSKYGEVASASSKEI